MNVSNFELIYEKAKEILANNYVLEQPIHIVEVVRNYELTVYETKFEDKNVLGFLDIDQKRIMIDRRAKDKQFICAYLFGHWILHRNELENENYTRFFKHTLKYANSIEKETEFFAFVLTNYVLTN